MQRYNYQTLYLRQDVPLSLIHISLGGIVHIQRTVYFYKGTSERNYNNDCLQKDFTQNQGNRQALKQGGI